MPIICPTILAAEPKQYKEQIERVASFAHRLQIDLTDGIFAGPLTVDVKEAWWPAATLADFHLMYDHPLPTVKIILKHHPHLIIVHAEAKGRFDEVLDYCQSRKVKVGVALLQKTKPQLILPALNRIDHVLIFSGELGKQGGNAHLDLLEKVFFLKSQKPSLEIGWDGGINDQNVSELVAGGVDVLNVGGFIQKAQDPKKAFETLQRVADETGTT